MEQATLKLAWKERDGPIQVPSFPTCFQCNLGLARPFSGPPSPCTKNWDLQGSDSQESWNRHTCQVSPSPGPTLKAP